MAQSTIAGYPVSPLERAVTGFVEGWQDTQKALKESLEYEQEKVSYEYRKRALAKMPEGGGGKTTTGREDPYAVEPPPGTTGSGGRRGGGDTGESQWGDYATPIVNYFRAAGYTKEAIAGIVANGLAEGGFSENWKAGDSGNSFGHWQFNTGGELPGYQDWARKNGVKDVKDSLSQARYVDYWLNNNLPNYKYLTNANTATDQFLSKFERPKPEHNYPGARYGQLATAQRLMGGIAPLGSGVATPPEGGQPEPGAGSGGTSTGPTGQPPVVQGKGSGPGGMMTKPEYDRSRAAPAKQAALSPGAMPTGLRPPQVQNPFTGGAPQPQMAALANPGSPYYGTATPTYDRPQAPPEQEPVLAQVMRQPGPYSQLGLPTGEPAYEDQYYGSVA